MKKSLKYWMAATTLVFASMTSLLAQNLKDDIAKNDLEGLKSKVALLSPDFREYPYIAYYLSSTDEYQQSMIDYLIDQGASVDQCDGYGMGPLFWAIEKSNFEAVKTLIAHKADVNAAWKIADRNSPRGISCPYFFDKTSVKFARYGIANFNVEPTQDAIIRPLYTGLFAKDTDIESALLKAGADPLAETYKLKDLKKSTGKTSVYLTNTVFDFVIGSFAVSGNQLSSEDDSDGINSTFFANAFQLWHAVAALPDAKQPKLTPELTSNIFAYFCMGNMKAFKAELVKTGDNTMAFLPYAALAENWDIVDIILKYNQIEINDPFNRSENLLSWTIEGLHAQAAKLLFDHGAVLPAKIPQQQIGNLSIEDPLDWAIFNDNVELVKLLIAHGANVNNASVPLSYAHAYPELRQILVDAGADTKAVVYYGNHEPANLLFDAAFKGYPESVHYYLDKGLDPDGLSPSTPPLLAAVHSGKPETLDLLLAKGADPHTLLCNDEIVNADRDLFFHPLREVVLNLADGESDPIKKSRLNAMAKTLAKAETTTAPTALKINLVRVDAGSFTMGNDNDQSNPKHEVRLSGFMMSTLDISAVDYYKLKRAFPKCFTTGAALRMSFLEAVQFCNELSAFEKLTPVYTIDGKDVQADKTANGYRLPTEAEWEYIASGSAVKGQINNMTGSNERKWEICWDSFAENPASTVSDPGWDKTNKWNQRTGRGAYKVYDRNPFDISDEGFAFHVVRNLAP